VSFGLDQDHLASALMVFRPTCPLKHFDRLLPGEAGRDVAKREPQPSSFGDQGHVIGGSRGEIAGRNGLADVLQRLGFCFPCQMQPGMAGHSTTNMPVSSGSIVTENFIGSL
jgi:hypothetical protein